MNRRSFLQALGLGTASVVLSPAIDAAPIAAAVSATAASAAIVIPKRYCYARVLVKAEILADAMPGGYAAIVKNDYEQIIRDIAHDVDRLIVEGRPGRRIALLAASVTVGEAVQR